MSVHFDRVRGRWIVRWRDNGRQWARRFSDEASALNFEVPVERAELDYLRLNEIERYLIASSAA